MIHIRAQRPFMRDQLELYIWRKENGRIYAAEPLVFKETGPSGFAQPALCIDGMTGELGAFQELMDELWRMGCRPSDYTASSTVDAVKYHLEDMRRLVFEDGRVK